MKSNTNTAANSVNAVNVTTTEFTVLPSVGQQVLVNEFDGIDAALKNSDIDSFTAVNVLEKLEAARSNWEGVELAASHARLYSILAKCYNYYLVMKSPDTTKEARAQLAKGLDRFIHARGFKTLSKTHGMNKVVKAVFGEDRRRVSAYSLALRVALTAGTGKTALTVAELPEWIAARGGIEEIRTATKSGGVTLAERIEVATTAVKNKPLMLFKPDTKQMEFSTDDVDRLMLLVVTYRPTGELEVNSIVKNQSVVNAALAAHYTSHKEDMQKVSALKTPAPQSAMSVALNSSIQP